MRSDFYRKAFCPLQARLDRPAAMTNIRLFRLVMSCRVGREKRAFLGV
jgi:hypothetical protein